MKNNKIVIIVFILMDFIILLFGNYISYAEYRETMDSKIYFSKANEANILVGDNKYTNDIAQEIIDLEDLNDAVINFIYYGTGGVSSWYYYGDSIDNQEYIKMGRFFNEDELSKPSNKVLVSEKAYFKNGKQKNIQIDGTEYEIIGVIDREFSEVNGVDYIFAAQNFINTDIKFRYQIINITSDEKIDENEVVDLIHSFDSDIAISTKMDTVENDVDFSNNLKQMKLIIKNTIYLVTFMVLLTLYFYVKERIYTYRVYQLFGISEQKLFNKVTGDFVMTLIIPLIVSAIIYYLLFILNGKLFYSEMFFIYFDIFLYLKVFLYHLIIALIITISVCTYIYIINIKRDLR